MPTRHETWWRQSELEMPGETFKPPFEGVQFFPRELFRRQTAKWEGLNGEIVSLTRKSSFQSDYCGRTHLLIAYEQAARDSGETVLEGVPRSTLRHLTRKLTFVPAGHRFHESQEPHTLLRVVHIHIDPCAALAHGKSRTDPFDLTPRLFFENPVLWQTALKFRAATEAGASTPRQYAEALGVVLVHELSRLNGGEAETARRTNGGLAGWQKQAVVDYIEANLRKQISLGELAELARLSPYHFCRTFKQSFGVPPHRYHMSRRIEHAKILLARPGATVTNVALDVGFSETSAFSTAFHKIAGQTPTKYRRSLV